MRGLENMLLKLYTNKSRHTKLMVSLPLLLPFLCVFCSFVLARVLVDAWNVKQHAPSRFEYHFADRLRLTVY
jgi:hypothetical protein